MIDPTGTLERRIEREFANDPAIESLDISQNTPLPFSGDVDAHVWVRLDASDEQILDVQERLLGFEEHAPSQVGHFSSLITIGKVTFSVDDDARGRADGVRFARAVSEDPRVESLRLSGGLNDLRHADFTVTDSEDFLGVLAQWHNAVEDLGISDDFTYEVDMPISSRDDSRFQAQASELGYWASVWHALETDYDAKTIEMSSDDIYVEVSDFNQIGPAEDFLSSVMDQDTFTVTLGF